MVVDAYLQAITLIVYLWFLLYTVAEQIVLWPVFHNLYNNYINDQDIPENGQQRRIKVQRLRKIGREMSRKLR